MNYKSYKTFIKMLPKHLHVQLEQEEFAAHQTARKKHEQLQAQDEERATLLSKKAAKLQRENELYVCSHLKAMA